MALIRFDCSKSDHELAQAIAERARALTVEMRAEPCPVSEVLMDIVATHMNGCPLRLAELLEADDFNFSHDVFGIRRHLNRETGELTRCFVPRFARPEREAVRS